MRGNCRDRVGPQIGPFPRVSNSSGLASLWSRQQTNFTEETVKRLKTQGRSFSRPQKGPPDSTALCPSPTPLHHSPYIWQGTEMTKPACRSSTNTPKHTLNPTSPHKRYPPFLPVAFSLGVYFRGGSGKNGCSLRQLFDITTPSLQHSPNHAVHSVGARFLQIVGPS